jgi:hypothetical protein
MLLKREILIPTWKSFMNAAKINSLRRDVLHKIAMELRNDCKKIHVFQGLGVDSSPPETGISEWNPKIL